MTQLFGTEFLQVTPLRPDGTVSPYDERITLGDIADYIRLSGGFANIVGDGSTITSVVGTDGLTTFTANYLLPDNTTIIANGGLLSVNAEPLVGLPDRVTIQQTDQVQILSSAGTSYLGSVAELLTAIGNALSPGINIDTVLGQPPSTPFLVTGELNRYPYVPVLSVKDQGGTLTAISSLSGTATASNGATAGTFSFMHPGLAATASFTFTVQDANGVLATSNAFLVSGSVPTAATMNAGTVPATAVHGVPITGVTGTITPSGATAWVEFFGPNGLEGPRQAWSGTSVPAIAPLVAGTYKYNVFPNQTGGSAKLYVSANITVS